jgi:16S rRNA (cytidine1402-2'-O)-methyltransferase
MKKGKLYLIPTRLGDNPPLEVLPLSIKRIIEELDDYIVENEKTARRFIKRISPKKSQGKLKIHILNKYTHSSELMTFLDATTEGRSIGLISEAGCPGVADPGSDIVRIAHDHDVKVIPLVGPSSIILALMSSGMNGQNFAFTGYLPIDKQERKAELKRLERLSFEKNQSQIFIETPYRNNKMLEDICSALHLNTRVCVACEITLPSEFIKTKTVKDWKVTSVDLHNIHKD